MMKRCLLAAGLALVAAQPLFAEDKKPKQTKLDPEKLKKDRKQFADFEKTLKDWKQVPAPIGQTGFLRLYRKEKVERLLAAVPRALLLQPFLIATSVAGGSGYAGWQWQDKLVRLERFNKKLLLVELNTRQRAKKDQPVAEVVQRTYANRLLADLPIQSIGPKGEILVDLGALLTGRLSTFFGYYFSLRTSLARFTKTKPFQNNVEVSIQMPLYGDGTFMTVHYSISRLPALKGYAARVADDRIGYFYTAIRDYTGGDPKEGRMVRYINRWKLEKADPQLAMSPPREPIVFYVEKTVPIPYRRAVAEGILEWNKAFEAVGIHDAIVVRQQTKTQFADLDPEDVNYNFFRWITSESAFAMGPSRVDPRNGRILDADIIFDDSMLRGYMRDYDVLIREAPKKMLTRSMARWLDNHPEHHPLARFRKWAQDGSRIDRARRTLGRLLPQERRKRGPLAPLLKREEKIERAEDLERLPAKVRRGWSCRIGHMLPQQLGLAQLAMGALTRAAAGPGFSKYLAEIVKETVMHEVGHTLGLRHNFKASSMLDLDTINSKQRPQVLSASVMDYHPVNLGLDKDRRGHFLTRTIGPYDHLAIEYGYKLCKEGSKELKGVARQIAAQGLPYATDEDLGSPDPLINTWDLGKDPIKFADSRLKLVKQLWKDLEKRSVKDDESYSRLRRALNITLFEVQMSAVMVARLVGGMSFFRDHRGDPKARPPAAVIDSAQQRRALEWLAENLFKPEALAVPPELQSKLAASRWTDWASRGWGASLDYSLFDRILQIQSWVLFFITADDVLARVWENERRDLLAKRNDPLTLPELFDTLEKAIFSELEQPNPNPSATRPVVSSERQNLQDAYMRRLVAVSLGNGISPPVANKLAWSRLQGLEKRFGVVLASAKLDPYTRAHLEVLRARSTKVRAAEYVHLASGGDALCSLVRPSEPRRPVPAPALLLLGLLALIVIRRREAVTTRA